jgi:hypothetical protein
VTLSIGAATVVPTSDLARELGGLLAAATSRSTRRRARAQHRARRDAAAAARPRPVSLLPGQTGR